MSTPVGNSARGNHGGAGAEIDHPRQQRDQRLCLTMPPSLSALRHDHVRPSLQGLTRLRHGLYLTDQSRASSPYGRREWTWIAEREHDGCRPMGKNTVQQLGVLGQAPRNKAAADASVAGARSFSLDPVPITVTPAEQAQTARVAYRCGEPASGDDIHGSQQDRVFDPQSSC